MLKPQARMRFEAPPMALERWNPQVIAAPVAAADDTTINIYSTIGEYGDGQGMTAKIVNNILRKADGREITVNINSPGGDFFEGNAIYNLLKEYKGGVNIRVVGLAASAASIVAMAGTKIEIAESGLMMIHNSWTIALGNRHDMEKVSKTLAKFDASMNEVYQKRTGMSETEIAAMMDDETWLDGAECIEQGFATSLLASDNIALDKDEKAQYKSVLRKVDLELAKAGMPRSDRRTLIKELTSTPGAAVDDDEPTPRAGPEFAEALKALASTTTLKQKD